MKPVLVLKEALLKTIGAKKLLLFLLKRLRKTLLRPLKFRKLSKLI
jgi:hypothetical protein